MRFWLSIIAILGIDQFTKWLIMATMQVGESQPFIGQWLKLTYVQNRGAAFGMLQGYQWFFLIAAGLVIAAFIFYNVRYQVPGPLRWWMGLAAAGAVGNFIDRFRFGHVIDFFDLGWWPVFNVADAAISIGGIMLVIYLLFVMKED